MALATTSSFGVLQVVLKLTATAGSNGYGRTILYRYTSLLQQT